MIEQPCQTCGGKRLKPESLAVLVNGASIGDVVDLPVERAIDAGDERTGVSIMRPTAEMDAGPVCLQREEPIAPDDTYGTLAGIAADAAEEPVVATLRERGLLVEAGRIVPTIVDNPSVGEMSGEGAQAEPELITVTTLVWTSPSSL